MIDVVDSFANKSLVTVPSLLGLDPEFRFEGIPLATPWKRFENGSEGRPLLTWPFHVSVFGPHTKGDEFLAVADRVSAYVRKTGLAATAKSLDEAAHAVKVAEIDPFAEPPLAIQQMSRYAWVPLAGTPAPLQIASGERGLTGAACAVVMGGG